MSEQLSSPDVPGSAAPATADRPAEGARWRTALSGPVVCHVAVVIVAGALVGAVLGALWEWVWTPPTGAAWQGEWFLDPDGVGQDVSSTGWFTLIGVVGGIVYGSLAARWGLRRPLATLVGVVLGSFAVTYVMYHVGHALGPDDPRVLALTTGDWEPIVSDLRLAGVDHPMRPFSLENGAVVAPAIGALIGLIGLFLGGSGGPRGRRGIHSGAHD